MKEKASAGLFSPIQAAREEAGFSREELAFKAGLSLWTIERIEAKRVRPHRATRRAIATALGLGAEVLEDRCKEFEAETAEAAA